MSVPTVPVPAKCPQNAGLIYLRARYYDPQNRRFTQEDPARDELNWYAYCGNNPVMFVDHWGLAVTTWDQKNCSIDDYNLLVKNDWLWKNGTKSQKSKAVDSSKKIREKYLSDNETLLSNGHVEEVFNDIKVANAAGGAISATTTVTYKRLYTVDAVYVTVKNVNVKVLTQSGFYVDSMRVTTGQSGLLGPTSVHEASVEVNSYSYSPNWGMVFDDGGAAFTTVGTNVVIDAYRGTSTQKNVFQIINQLYYKEVIYNGKNQVEGIDVYDTILGGGR